MRTFTVTGGSSIHHELKSQLYMTKSMSEISAPQWGTTSRLLGGAARVVNAQASRTLLKKYIMKDRPAPSEDMDLLLNQDPPYSGLVYCPQMIDLPRVPPMLGHA
ncbi:uncharacterized protein AKAW2_30199A [Aspergillus luchuensis]|uniref:Uncharacterized protein n=1 Tax=Aspergillus kawachii TaxID=1069201 RepID=A0A7R7W5R8_ASPKA|nr:uncharacterized protein AKAW2_30199A [Aspergillus luchuensis]BCR96880.1 hypothetical protein AKAW2_30199A [Aspergillus luchuensis]